MYEMLESLVEAQEAAGISPPKVTIKFIGHSMGAAVATIAAGRFKWDQKLPPGLDVKDITVKMHNFGSPRVGDVAFGTVSGAWRQRCTVYHISFASAARRCRP